MTIQIPPALRQKRFAIFWAGLLISIAGSMMQIKALVWHLSTLSSQPIVVSGIGLVRFLPILFLAPVGGLFADSFNRRHLLAVTQTTLALVATTLGLLTWLKVIQIWHIYLLAGIQAVAMAFDLPARQALTPNLVTYDVLPSAYTMQSIAMNTGAIVGPALSGVVIGSLGQEWAYWFNALSFLAVLIALALIGPVPQEIKAIGKGIRANLNFIAEGARFIVQKPIILSSMLLDFAATFFSSATTLLPFVTRDILKAGSLEYGWLASAEAIGAVATGAFMSQRTRFRNQGRLLLGAVAIYGLATILFGLSRSFLPALLALTMVGCGDTISTILRNTIRQLQTPDRLRGRMISINQIFFQGGPQLGEIESGLVAQAFGTPFAIISGGIGCILCVFLIAAGYPTLRRYNGEDLQAVKAD